MKRKYDFTSIFYYKRQINLIIIWFLSINLSSSSIGWLFITLWSHRRILFGPYCCGLRAGDWFFSYFHLNKIAYNLTTIKIIALEPNTLMKCIASCFHWRRKKRVVSHQIQKNRIYSTYNALVRCQSNRWMSVREERKCRWAPKVKERTICTALFVIQAYELKKKKYHMMW